MLNFYNRKKQDLGMVLISIGHWVKGGWISWTGYQFSTWQNEDAQGKTNINAHFQTQEQLRETDEPNSHLFGLWEKAGISGELPHMLI